MQVYLPEADALRYSIDKVDDVVWLSLIITSKPTNPELLSQNISGVPVNPIFSLTAVQRNVHESPDVGSNGGSNDTARISVTGSE